MSETIRRDLLLKDISLQKLKLRRFYRNNFVNFAHDIMGNKDVSRDVHGEYCQRLQDAYWGRNQILHPNAVHRYLNLLPRKSLKTVLGAVAGPVWIAMQNDPVESGEDVQWEAPPSFNGKPGFDQRFFLNHETDDQASRYLGNIVSHLQRNDALRNLFGVKRAIFWKKRSEGKWSSWEVNMPWRRDLSAKEANYTTGSLKSSSAGGHYDWALFDDIFTEMTIDQVGGPEKVRRFYEDYLLVADNPSVLWLNGTIYRDNDLYCWLMDYEPHKWSILREKARWASEEEARENGRKRRLFFPAKLDDAALDDLLETLGPVKFGRQLQNEPLSDETQEFKPHYFEIYRPTPDEPAWLKTCTVITTADPKIFDPDLEKNEEKRRDAEAAILTCAWDPKAHLWTLDYFTHKNLTPGEFLDEFFRQIKTWGTGYAGFEEVAFQKVLRFPYELKCVEHKIYPNYVPLKPGHRQKFQRIRGLEPLARRGQIHFREGHENLKHQLVRFPFGKTVDGIDVLAYQLDIAVQAVYPAFEKPSRVEEVLTEQQQLQANFERKLREVGLARFGASTRNLTWMDA